VVGSALRPTVAGRDGSAAPSSMQTWVQSRPPRLAPPSSPSPSSSSQSSSSLVPVSIKLALVQLLPRPHLHRAHRSSSSPRCRSPSSSPSVQLLTSPPVQLLPAAGLHQAHHGPAPPVTVGLAPHLTAGQSPPRRRSSNLVAPSKARHHPCVGRRSVSNGSKMEREYMSFRAVEGRPDRCAFAPTFCWS
jgi:hypothetical protein